MAKSASTYQEGQAVETVYGEKCTVLRVEKDKLLLQGTAELPCWFPYDKIKVEG